MSAQDKKQKVIAEAIKTIHKQFGSGSIMRLDGKEVQQVDVIPTGSVALDVALGIGGLPRGRIVEIFGPESSGKTTLTLHAIAEAQAAGGVCAFIDAEHALDTEYARRLGVQLDDLLVRQPDGGEQALENADTHTRTGAVDLTAIDSGAARTPAAARALDRWSARRLGVQLDDLLVSQPDCGEQALEIADTLTRTGAVDLIVIDSVAALTPRAEIEGEMGESHMGLQARLMSQALRKLAGSINRSNCAVVFINQLREKIGVMFGNPETTTGGKALKFYASLRLDIRRIGPVKERETVIGNHVRVKVVKNKVAPPFRQAEFDVMFDEGISHTSLLVDLAAEAGIIQKSGAWYSYGDQRIGQGRENAKLFLKDNPPLLAEVEGRVKEFLGMKVTATVPADADGEADDGDAE